MQHFLFPIRRSLLFWLSAIALAARHLSLTPSLLDRSRTQSRRPDGIRSSPSSLTNSGSGQGARPKAVLHRTVSTPNRSGQGARPNSRAGGCSMLTEDWSSLATLVFGVMP
ncbi:hypothetical protein E2562_036494 [Oryza meyeriana var. granulata]|uniref:Secreted protein n=1 Tax=Oryza meyeriana var. granulata TaxID=110450 RepID=A0A6G1CBE3_9ORYZ|nr:hypothetical protein E2562_036494 [Oryza meyeriana var. granulata]